MTCGAMSPTNLTTCSELAVERTGVTLMAALRMRIARSLRCSGRTTVTTSPALPARAVRPLRCR